MKLLLNTPSLLYSNRSVLIRSYCLSPDPRVLEPGQDEARSRSFAVDPDKGKPGRDDKFIPRSSRSKSVRRFIYAPEVQDLHLAQMKLDKTFDVSKDVISGSVTSRLDAVSTATFVLQNKFGLYTRKFKPMDRIAIFMRRIGNPMLVFTGYVDEAPFYQMFPQPVTDSVLLSAQAPPDDTYFDPGLPFMTQWFQKFGWIYDPASMERSRLRSVDSQITILRKPAQSSQTVISLD
jgi:hypothetical protein